VARAVHDLRDHVILCGYGRVGRNLARYLHSEGVPFVALDLDAEQVEQAKDSNDLVIYGDAGRYSLLQAAGVERARAVAISFGDPPMALKVIRQIRNHLQELPILARAIDEQDLAALDEAGATDAVPETLEASLVMGAQLLLLLGVPSSRVESQAARIRGDHYRPEDGILRSRRVENQVPGGDELRTLQLTNRSFAAGRSLSEFSLHDLGVQLLAVHRSGTRIPEPSLDTSLRAGDILILYGPSDGITALEKSLLEGHPPNLSHQA
jgi:CPA2 family monovalent cation:H+ antiporter-2